MCICSTVYSLQLNIHHYSGNCGPVIHFQASYVEIRQEGAIIVSLKNINKYHLHFKIIFLFFLIRQYHLFSQLILKLQNLLVH